MVQCLCEMYTVVQCFCEMLTVVQCLCEMYTVVQCLCEMYTVVQCLCSEHLLCSFQLSNIVFLCADGVINCQGCFVTDML